MDEKNNQKKGERGNVLRLVERGLKKISVKENKTSKIMADIFLFLYVAASHGTTTFKPYSREYIVVCKKRMQPHGLIREKKGKVIVKKITIIRWCRL